MTGNGNEGRQDGEEWRIVREEERGKVEESGGRGKLKIRWIERQQGKRRRVEKSVDGVVDKVEGERRGKEAEWKSEGGRRG